MTLSGVLLRFTIWWYGGGVGEMFEKSRLRLSGYKDRIRGLAVSAVSGA